MTAEQAAIIKSYADRGIPAITAKGGGFFLRGRGRVSLSAARKETGINMAVARGPRMEALPWGDFATVAMLNRR